MIKTHITADLEAAAIERENYRDEVTLKAITYYRERSERLERGLAAITDLLHWFAAKYADNNPLFPEVDGLTGQELPANAELSATWYRVIRGGVRCEECKGAGRLVIPTDERDVAYIESCAACEGRGYISTPTGAEERPGG